MPEFIPIAKHDKFDLVTDDGDLMYGWQLLDVGDGFCNFDHQHTVCYIHFLFVLSPAINIQNMSLLSHKLQVTSITISLLSYWRIFKNWPYPHFSHFVNFILKIFAATPEQAAFTIRRITLQPSELLTYLLTGSKKSWCCFKLPKRQIIIMILYVNSLIPGSWLSFGIPWRSKSLDSTVKKSKITYI